MKEVRGVSFQQLSPLSQSSVLDVGAAAAAFLQPLDRIPAERSAQCLLHLCFPTDFTELGEGKKNHQKPEWTANFPFKNMPTEAAQLSTLIQFFLFLEQLNYSSVMFPINPVGICVNLQKSGEAREAARGRKTGNGWKRMGGEQVLSRNLLFHEHLLPVWL